MLWAPAMSAAVLHVAVLELPLPTSATPAQPLIAVPPSAKVTGPVGPEPVTVAVKLTVARATDGLAELTTPVVLKFLFTTCESPALIDPLFFTIQKEGKRRILEYVGRTTPKLREGKKWKDLDAVTVFEWK